VRKLIVVAALLALAGAGREGHHRRHPDQSSTVIPNAVIVITGARSLSLAQRPP
jgi:hypothetical protein